MLNGGTQKLDEYGVWTADTFGLDAKGLGQTHLNLSLNLIGGVYQSGALFSYANEPETITIRVGVSFVSADQACQNAETEVGTASFETILNQTKALWNDKLHKIEIDVANTPANVTELLYSSLYRTFLTPVRPIFASCFMLTFSIRTTLLRRRRDCMRILLPSTSTPSIAGMS